MTTTPQSPFRCEVEESTDSQHQRTVTVKCHGRLVSEHVETLKGAVKPLIERGAGVIVIDCQDVSFLDSLGLGALVGLKVSALHKTDCSIKLVHVSARVIELLRLTRLDEFLSY